MGNMVYIYAMGTMIIKKVPDDLRDAFKILCLQRKTNMREAIIKYMKEEVAKPLPGKS